MKNTQRLLLFFISLICCLSSQIDRASAQGQRVRVGLFDNKPMCSRESGKPAGIFVVVLEYVAEQEGWQLEYVDGAWGELRQLLEAGEIDILPSMALSDQRQKIYAFNNLDVFTNWGEIYVPTGSKIHTFFDLQGKRVAAMDKAIYTSGPEGIIKLNDVFGVQSDIVLVSSYTEALQAVKQGQADAAVVNRLTAPLRGGEFDFQKSGIVFSPVKIRFGLNKDNPRTPGFIAAIDKHFQLLLDDLSSPYRRELERVFDDRAHSFPMPPWVNYVLGMTVFLIFLLLPFIFLLRHQVETRTKAFRVSEARFQAIAENCLDWIWEFDEHEKFTYASPRIKDLLGYSPEEVVGKSAFDLIPSPEKEKVALEFNTLKASRQAFALLENINQHKDGHLVTLESSGAPIFDERGVFKGYRGIDRDITEKKAIEEKLRQAQKMEAIGTLAGGIAHDFNNILSAIFGYAELVKLQMAEKKEVAADVDQILHAAERARGLVKQILTFSRQNKQEKQVVQLSLVVKEALKLLRPSIPTTITIESDIASSARIFADLTQINQVIMNLCTNAYHAMEESGGTLSISLTETQLESPRFFAGSVLKTGQYVVLEVCDTGKGIGREIVAKIFDPYFTTKDTGRGTGLGLAVVHGVVLSHHGAIEVASEEGQGACFTVYLPLLAEEEGQEEGSQAADVGGGQGERILVVDDEEGLRQVVSRILVKGGYRADVCANGQEALEALAEQGGQYDLLLTDMTMPVMTGKELALQVMERYPALPIVICTGYSSQLRPEDLRIPGVERCLAKPLARAELLRQIRQTLDQGKGAA